MIRQFNQEKQLIEQVLVHGRNDLWVNQVLEYTAEYDTFFLAVGTAHLWGEQCIVRQLADYGFTVERVGY